MNNRRSLRCSTRLFLLVLTCLFSVPHSYAQINPHTGPTTPDGLLDSVSDMYGSRYALADLIINDTVAGRTGGPSGPQPLIALTCNTGYFQAHLEVGCGMDGNTAQEIARRAVLCAVLNDLSNFINSPLTSTGEKVHIWVRDLANINGVPGNALGLATSFYNVPYNPAVSGIVDNTTWITIHSGKDAYTNVANPLFTQGGVSTTTNGTFFHAMMGFNFNTIAWNTTLNSSTVPFGQFDLYTVMLHEMLHALGFSSLIGSTGASVLGNGFPYYSRYDMRLQTQGGVNLISNTGMCSLYNFSFTGPVSALTAPGACTTNQTTCSTAVRYNGSVVEPVYRPNCWEQGSSLSHFEDMCPTTANNDLIWVMSNAAPSGLAKRYPKASERQVLCDIGYSVNNTFGSAPNSSFFTYSGAACPGITVAGINDGISNLGAYTYVYTGGPAITVSNALSNDFQAVTMECVRLVNGSGTITATTSTSFSYLPTTSAQAVHLISYIPVSATGQRGNITYVYIYASSSNCTGNACNLVNNSGFENSTGAGPIGQTIGLTLPCWQPVIANPDLFSPGNNGWYSMPTTFNVPTLNSHDGTPNDHFIGIWSMRALYGYTGYGQEAIQATLSSGLQPGQQYLLRFWAKVANYNPGLPFTANQFINYSLEFGATTTPTAPTVYHQSFPSNVNYLTQTTVAPVLTNNNSNGWTPITLQFTYNGSTPGNFLYISGAPYLNSVNPAAYEQYVFLDDFSIEPLNGACLFNLPAQVSTCTPIPGLSDLSNFVTVPGGVFAGPGVALSGGIYSFDPLVAGPGVHTLTYTYTDGLGCVHTISDQIEVVNGTGVTVTANPSSICVGQTVTLTASGGTSYTWSPSITCTLPCATGTDMPTSTTTYTVTDAGSGCTGMATVTVGMFSATITPAGPLTFCQGGSVVLNANTGTGFTYQWYESGNPISGATLSSYTASTSGSYTVQINNGFCTSTSATITVTVLTPPTVSITPSGPVNLCPGQTVTFTAVPGTGLSYQWSNTSGPIPGATSASYTTSIPGTYTVTAWVPGSLACPGTASVTVNYTSININVTPQVSTIMNCQSVNLTASGATSYTWTPVSSLNCSTCASVTATPTASTTYTITGTQNGCTAATTATVNVSNPATGCSPCAQLGNNFNVLSGTVTATSLTGYYYVSSNVTFTSPSVNISNAVMLIAPGVTITVNPNTLLTISKSHLYGCTNMWNGIVLLNNGTTNSARIRVTNNSLIEDAKTAIAASNSVTPAGVANIIYIDATIFNRNKTAIAIGNYTPTSYQTGANQYPFLFFNDIFTSRDFSSFTSGLQAYPLVWPQAAAMKVATFGTNPFAQPYALNTSPYGMVNCKDGNPAQKGFALSNVGASVGAAYREIVIGDQVNTTVNFRNLFDNLDCGIEGLQTNVTSVDNSFTNIRRAGAIYVSNNNSANINRRLRVLPVASAPTATNNVFYDCMNNVMAYNYYDVQGVYSKMFSVHSLANQTMGVYGYNVQTWKYSTIYMNNNEINNIDRAINVNITGNNSGIFFPGLITITLNKIQAHPAGLGSITSQFVTQAISVAASAVCSACPAVGANVDNNNIWDAYNGIYVANFLKQKVTSNYNSMRIRHNTTNPLQAGIDHKNCAANVIRNNTLTGSGSIGSPYRRRGITTTACPNQYVLCNSVNGYGKAFEFFGNSLGTIWMQNQMANSGRGFVINGAGTALGPQGSLTMSYGNKWNGAWPGGTFHTFSENQALPNLSRLYCQIGTGNYPTLNSANPSLPPYIYTTNTNGLFVVSGLTTFSCGSSTLPMPAVAYHTQLEDVAYNTTSYSCDSPRIKWIAQYSLWEALRIDTTLRDSSIILDDFGDSASISRMAYLTDMEDDLVSGNYTGLRTKVDNPPSNRRTYNFSNNVEVFDDAAATVIIDNYREFYDLYLRYLGDTLDTTDTVRLQILSRLCPLTNGNVIFQARALYDAVVNDGYAFEDAFCACGVYTSRTIKPGSEGGFGIKPWQNLDGGAQQYTLSPNPSNGNITLQQAVIDDAPVRVQVSSAAGQHIYRGTLNFTQGRVNLHLDNLSAGMYVMQLVDKNGATYIIKFTILL